MDLIKRNKILVGIIAIALVVTVWFTLSNKEQGSLVTTVKPPPEEQAADSSIVQTLLKLRAIRLDGTIFTDKAFQELKDFSTQIIPEPIGRPNPFAPLGSAGYSTSTPQPPARETTRGTQNPRR